MQYTISSVQAIFVLRPRKNIFFHLCRIVAEDLPMSFSKCTQTPVFDLSAYSDFIFMISSSYIKIKKLVI